jgi:hypothetical protein
MKIANARSLKTIIARKPRLSSASSRNTLLDHSAAKVSVNQTAICILDCRAKICIRHLVLPCKASECLVLEHPHSRLVVMAHEYDYNTEHYTSSPINCKT